MTFPGRGATGFFALWTKCDISGVSKKTRAREPHIIEKGSIFIESFYEKTRFELLHCLFTYKNLTQKKALDKSTKVLYSFSGEHLYTERTLCAPP
jgi:hypothetical protein